MSPIPNIYGDIQPIPTPSLLPLRLENTGKTNTGFHRCGGNKLKAIKDILTSGHESVVLGSLRRQEDGGLALMGDLMPTQGLG